MSVGQISQCNSNSLHYTHTVINVPVCDRFTTSTIVWYCAKCTNHQYMLYKLIKRGFRLAREWPHPYSIPYWSLVAKQCPSRGICCPWLPHQCSDWCTRWRPGCLWCAERIIILHGNVCMRGPPSLNISPVYWQWLCNGAIFALAATGAVKAHRGAHTCQCILDGSDAPWLGLCYCCGGTHVDTTWRDWCANVAELPLGPPIICRLQWMCDTVCELYRILHGRAAHYRKWLQCAWT
jgi:hypothetical protein